MYSLLFELGVLAFNTAGLIYWSKDGKIMI